MNEEKALTIYRPIRSDDSCIINVMVISISAPQTASIGQKYINNRTKRIYTYTENGWGKGEVLSNKKIYFIDNEDVYKRWINNKLNNVDYVEFPDINNPIRLNKFKYDAQRMGKAPTISSSIMSRECLDNEWSLDCFVLFKGERYYLNKIPNSSKDNIDSRYKHDAIFVSERSILENVYLFDVVSPYQKDRPTNQSSIFSFFGDINALRKRINASLVNSGISKYVFKQGVTSCPTLKEFTSWANDGNDEHKSIYNRYNGDYNYYLQSEIYEYKNGEFTIDGYQVIIGNDANGKKVKSEEKLITFENNKIYDALYKIDDIFGLKFYFQGKNIIIGDCDVFIDLDLKYGYDGQLLSVQKAIDTNPIITRCTGIGSSDNIPYYYPNPTEDGFLGVLSQTSKGLPTLFKVSVIQKNGANVDSFNKNRLSDKFVFGKTTHLNQRLIKFINLNEENSCIEIDWSFLPKVNGFILFESGFPFKNLHPDFIAHYRFGLEIIDVDLLKQKKRCPIYAGYGLVSFTVRQSTADLGIDYIGYFHATIKDTITTIGYNAPSKTFNIKWDGGIFTENAIRAIAIVKYENGKEKVWYQEELKSKIKSIESNVVSITTLWSKPIVNNDIKPTVSYKPHSPIENGLYLDMISMIVYIYIQGKYYIIDENNTKYNPFFKELTKPNALGLIFHDEKWYKNGKEINLQNYGIDISGEPQVNDIIKFNRIKYLTPQGNLMPDVYIKTDGEERFYNAVNYPRLGTLESDVNTNIGERYNSSIIGIENPLYHDDSIEDIGDKYNQYHFNNEYNKRNHFEHIEKFDIKPTIVGMKNENGDRIDVIQEFAYDVYDNDETWNVNEKDKASIDFKHPHFYAKLRPLGFNLFDCALEKGEMIIGMTSGNCGSCKFKIKVDSKTLKNPVQVWEYDVYEKSSTSANPFVKVFSIGDLKRNYKERMLYKKTDNGYEMIDSNFYGITYTNDDILNDKIGSLKVDNKEHFEGDVVNYGRFQDVQQDTTNDYVWVALEKEESTYGVIMPSAKPIYDNGVLDTKFSSFIRPKAFKDTSNEDTADKFVIINILLPQAYINDAQIRLSKAIIKYMAENNTWSYDFTIKFSKIYLEKNQNIRNLLNENSKLKILYNGIKHIVYVSSYSYRITDSNELPDITVDLRENLRTAKYSSFFKNIIGGNTNGTIEKKDVTSLIDTIMMASDNRFVTKNGNAIISGKLFVGNNDKVAVLDEIEKSNEFIVQQNKVNYLVKSLDENRITLVNRSNELLQMLKQLSVEIETFNKENEKTITPLSTSWRCVDSICSDLDDLIVIKPLEEL